MKRFLFSLIAVTAGLMAGVMVASASNTSGVSPLIQNIPGRETQMLDGHWKYKCFSFRATPLILPNVSSYVQIE